MTTTRWIRFVIKPGVFILGLLPLALLILGVLNFTLGADPQQVVVHETGAWALNFLLLTLMVSPLRQFTGISQLLRFRRLLGLFCYFYATLHLASYYLLLLEGDLANLAEDIFKRPYITVGFACWVILTPLAFTSTRAMMRRLGRRWQILHRGIYIVAVGAIAHFLWLVKSDLNKPLGYGLLVVLLLAYRLWRWRKRNASMGATKPEGRVRLLAENKV